MVANLYTINYEINSYQSSIQQNIIKDLTYRIDMNKVLAAILMLGSMSSLIAEMRFNPLTNCYYSYPEVPDINQHEYIMLLIDCGVIKERIIAANLGIQPDAELIINQYALYLNSVGTPTALRLLADFRKNSIHLSNGAFLRNICY